MKKQFQSLTEKGRWLLATLTLIFTLGVGQMWGNDYTFEASTFASDKLSSTVDGQTFGFSSAHSGGGSNSYADGQGSKYIKIGSGKTMTITFPNGFVASNLNIKGYTNKDNKTNGEISEVAGVAQSGKTFPARNTGNVSEYNFGISSTATSITFKTKGSTEQACLLITITGTPPACTQPAIVWNVEPAGGEVGDDDFDASVTTTPENHAVTWSSSITSAATVNNGTIHYVAPGLPTIQASLTYTGEDYCNITVSTTKTILVPITTDATGTNDKYWYYTTEVPSGSSDNGLNYSGTKSGSGLYGTKLNDGGYAWFAKPAVAGTLRVGAFRADGQGEDYEVNVYACNNEGTKDGDALGTLSTPHIGGVSTPMDIAADVAGIRIERKTSKEGVLYFVEFKAAAETAVCPSGLSISGTAAYDEGETISLEAALTAGNGEISYKWYKGSIAAGNEIGTGATFTKENCVPSDAGNYYCVAIKDGCDNVESNAYAVTVTPAVDCSSLAGTIYKFQIKTSGLTNGNLSESGTFDVTTSNYLASISGGTLQGYNENNKMTVYGNSSLQLSDNSKSYFIAELDCPLQAGDTIKSIVTGNTALVSKADSKTEDVKLQTSSNATTYNKVVIPTTNNIVGETKVYIWKGGGNCQMRYFEVIRPAKYAVTYTAGDGSVKEGQSLPTQAATVEGGKFNTALGTALEKNDYDFAGWQWTDDESNTHNIAANTEFTMPAYPVTFVAQWTLHVDKYTVKYMDGEDLLDSEEVTVGEHPAGITNPTKALYTFVNWKNGDDVVNPTDLSGTANQVITLQAQWSKVYVAQGTEYVFENNATVGEKSVTTTEKDYDAFMIGNMSFSATRIQYEAGTGGFGGWKIKKANATIKFFVENDSRVTVTVGTLSSGCNIAYTNTSEEAQDVALAAAQANNYDVKGGTLVTLTMQGGSTVTLKEIAVSEIPALSDDATLKSLKVGGTLIAGFSPAVTSYYVEMPYGTAKADLPLVTVEVNEEHAVAVVQDAKNRPDDTRATIAVTAYNGTTVNYYYVYFYNAPKYGVELIKAKHNGTESGATVTGYIGGTVDKLTQSGGKLGSDDPHHYFGIQLASGKFQVGDMLVIKASALNGGNAATLYSDKGVTAISTNGSFDATTKMYIYTLTAETEKIYLYRQSSACNPNVDYMAVYRYMPSFIEEFKIGEAVGTIDQENKTIAIEVLWNTDVTALTPTVKAWANGGATVTPEGAQDFTNPVVYTVNSAYPTEDAAVQYTVTVTKADHYEAQIETTGYTTLAAAVAAANANDVVKLLDNVDVTADGLTIGTNMTLDLNGYNIKAGEQLTNDIYVPAGVKLTLVDNSANAEGKIYTEEAYSGAATGYGVIRVSGEFLMQSGNIYAVIESDPANLGQFAVVLGAGGKATIEGGQIKAGWYAISNNGNNTGSTIIVSGGELISTADFAIYNPAKESTVTVSGGVVYGAAGGIAMNRGELTVTGGTITSKDQGTTGTWGDGTGGLSNAAIAASGKYESVEVEISGGTIIAEGTAVMITNGTTNPVEVAISGGQFSHVVPAEYCADGFAPVTTPNAQGKYEVYAVGIIHAAATQNSDNIYMCTLDNNVKIYASNSEGKLSTSTMTATSSDVTACGGDAGGFNVNKSAFVLQFPVNVKEFTLFGANSNERTISKVYVNAEASADIKISTVGRELTGAYSNTKDEKCQTLTAVFAGENIIPANEYVLLTLSGSVNFYRVLYTEAECTTPTVAVADQAAKENVAVTLTAEASALGATYQWYTCDDALGTNPVIIAGKTAKTLSVTKVGTADQYYRVVVGCNCSAETASAVAKVSLYTEATSLVDVTENTVWDWTEVTNDVDGAAITSDGKTVNGANGILANYLQGADWNKLESNNGAYAIRSNSNKYYQGASLHFHATKGGILKINARNDGNAMKLKVGNIEYQLTNSFKDYVLYVQAGDVTIENVPETAGKPMRVAKITFTVKETPDYTRNVTNNIGTLCVNHNVLAGGALGATFYQIASRNELYDYKIDFEEVLPGEELKAGQPYIFQSNTGKIELFYGTTEADAPEAVRGMYGSFVDAHVDITSENMSDILYIAQNKLWNCEDLVGSYLEVIENRAYIVMSDVPTYEQYQASQNSNNAPRRRVTLGKDEAQVVTGFGELETSETPVKVLINGQIFIIRGEKMFDVTGKLVK